MHLSDSRPHFEASVSLKLIKDFLQRLIEMSHKNTQPSASLLSMWQALLSQNLL